MGHREPLKVWGKAWDCDTLQGCPGFSVAERDPLFS